MKLSEQLVGKDDPPIDHCHLCYSILFLLALAVLLPWNAFISSSGFFAARLAGTRFAVNFENFFGVAYNVTNVLSLAVLTYTKAGSWSVRTKVLYPYIITFFVFAFMTCASLIPPEALDAEVFFWISLGLIMLCGLCNSLIQAGLFGLASRLPEMYVQGLVAGQGMGGVVPAVLVVITVVASPVAQGTPTLGDVKWSAFSFFLMAALTDLIAIFAYLWLEHLSLPKYYGAMDLATNSDEEESVGPLQPIDQESLIGEEIDWEGKYTDRSVNRNMTPALRKAASIRTYNDISSMAWGVLINFTVSLAVFPAITANIYSPYANAHEEDGKIKFEANPEQGRFYGDLFVPIYCFLFFNIFDFFGRMLAGKFPNLLPNRAFLPLSIARFVFLPLFMLCNVVEVGESMIPTVFTAVWWPILFMTLLATSNGYLVCQQFMKAPSMVPDVLQDSAGRMMCFFTAVGLLSGSTLSFFLHFLLCSCNPVVQ